MYTKEEALLSSIEYFDGDDLAADVFVTKYALTDQEGVLRERNPDGMHKRLAREFARIESNYPNPISEDTIYSLLKDFKYIIPQGSPMAGIGNDYQVQSLSNCFVIDSPADSYGGILFTDQEMVQLMKRRGGVGFDISPIRPKGCVTANAARTTDGIESFMERFSNSTREVAQGGRRGALMITIDVSHTQIRDFIRIKRNLKKVTGANISIRLSEKFMNAVKSDTAFTLQWPVNVDDPEMSESVNARELWDEIIQSAWECAEPGLMFWDNITKSTPSDAYTDIGFGSISSNPCSEIIMPPNDACRLLLLNLSSFVENQFLDSAKFDWTKFREVAMQAQRLMDDLVDLEIEKIDTILEKVKNDPESDNIKKIETDLWNKIREKALLGRRTGLGITALADTIAMMGFRYGSDDSIVFVEKLFESFAIAAHKSSCIMAEERGAFEVFSHEKEANHEYLNRIMNLDTELYDLYMKHGRRNIALTTIAPSGSVSVLTQTSSGIEPVFKVKYTRRRKITHAESAKVDYIDPMGDKWVEYDVHHHGFTKWMNVTGGKSIEESPYKLSTAEEIDWRQRVKLQSTAQKYIDHSISSTLNLPNDATVDDVREIYEAAHSMGCKGFTVYREGSRSGVLIDKSAKTEDKKFKTVSAPKRPDTLPCHIHHAAVKGERWIILIGLLSGKPYEIIGGLSELVEIPKKYKSGFITKRSRKTVNSIYDLSFGENGDEVILKNIVKIFDNPDHSSFTRLLSLSLRHGASVNYICEQLLKGDRDGDLFSFIKVISRVLKHYIEDGTTPGGDKTCSECGAEDSLVYQEGCVACISCSWSKC